MLQDSDRDSTRDSLAEVKQLLTDANVLMNQTRLALERFSEPPPLRSINPSSVKPINPIKLADAGQTAKRIIALRRERDKLFSGLSARDVLGEPAWEMLLDLFVARAQGQRVSVSSLCIASYGPQTTALRYISTMTQKGIIIRTPDEDDQRRVFLTLSKPAFEAMNTLLGKLAMS